MRLLRQLNFFEVLAMPVALIAPTAGMALNTPFAAATAGIKVPLISLLASVHAGQQLAHCERLHQVVVGACGEAGRPVIQAVAVRSRTRCAGHGRRGGGGRGTCRSGGAR
jgi:hypothetical protein